MRKNNKRALMLSCLSLLLCVSLLIGATFAWFTDTATTAITTVQSGTLDIVLERQSSSGEWVSAEGQTLEFEDTDSTLWEPGATYKLPKLRLTNKGNLKLKYDMEITGITGDAKLNKAIDWSIQVAGQPYNKDNTIHPMEPGASFEIEISGHMREDAGNEYQGLTIDGIGLTVYATQLGGTLEGVSGEYDSDGFTYDEKAEWPVRVIIPLDDEAMTPVMDTTGNVITGYQYENSTGTVKATTTAAAATEGAKPGMKLSSADAATGSFVVNNNQGTIAYDIEITNLKTDENGNLLTNAGEKTYADVAFVSNPGMEDIQLFHKGEQMAKVGTITAVDQFTYNAESGLITVRVEHFSNFTIVYNKPVAFNQNDEFFTSLQTAINDSDSTKVTLCADIEITDANAAAITIAKDLTVDFDKYTLSLNIDGDPKNFVAIRVNSGDVTFKGTTGGIANSNNVELYDVILGQKDGTANLTIEGGKYYAGTTAVSVNNGTLTVNGGEFSAYTADTRYVLNCIDAAYNAGTAKIIVNGGTFKGFDPANNAAEGADTNFCGENYETVEANGWYSIVEKQFIKTSENTYTISGAKGLREFSDKVNAGNKFEGKTISLTQDIDLMNESFTPIGNSSQHFFGTFDGANHTVKNLKVDLESNKDATQCAGLFGWGAAGSVIKNLTIDGAKVEGHHWVGTLVGYTYGSVDNCTVKNADVVNTHYDAEACGDKTGLVIGFVPSDSQGPIKNIHGINGTVAGARDVGQLIGAGQDEIVDQNTCSAENVTVSRETSSNCTDTGAGTNINNAFIGRVL